MSSSVVYLWHKIDADGLHPVADKIKAIVDAPRPQSVHELKSYLGLLSYYSKTILAPLYTLLRKEATWHWSKNEEEAFTLSKELLTSSDVLVHYNPEHKLVLACDASASRPFRHITRGHLDTPPKFFSKTLDP